MTCYRLADRLHMTLDQVLAMPADHHSGWLAYFAILEKERED